MSNPRTTDLTTGSIPRHLWRLSVPMVWGILAIVSMQLTDVYFVAGLGQTQLEAIGFTFPMSMVIFNLVMGLSIGTSSVCSRLVGAGDMSHLSPVYCACDAHSRDGGGGAGCSWRDAVDPCFRPSPPAPSI